MTNTSVSLTNSAKSRILQSLSEMFQKVLDKSYDEDFTPGIDSKIDFSVCFDSPLKTSNG